MEKQFKGKSKTEMCKRHKPMNGILGYIAWHDWAEKKFKRGAKQTQCPKCGHWLFKCEY